MGETSGLGKLVDSLLEQIVKKPELSEYQKEMMSRSDCPEYVKGYFNAERDQKEEDQKADCKGIFIGALIFIAGVVGWTVIKGLLSSSTDDGLDTNLPSTGGLSSINGLGMDMVI